MSHIGYTTEHKQTVPQIQTKQAHCKHHSITLIQPDGATKDTNMNTHEHKHNLATKQHTDCQHDSLTLLLPDGATILSPPLDLWSWVASRLTRKHHVLSFAYNLVKFHAIGIILVLRLVSYWYCNWFAYSLVVQAVLHMVPQLVLQLVS